MVNIWEFSKKLGRIRITTTDGKTHEGKTVCVTDAEEAGDIDDYIVIQDDIGGIQHFYVSEIADIQRVKRG